MTPAPAAPGALGRPPGPGEVLDYLAAMTRWTAGLRAALDEVDARARLGGTDTVLTADITLAYALGQSIGTRVGEITRVWDSGRVGPAELEEIGRLLWSRLDEGSTGGGLSVSLTEACVLAEALLARLTHRLEDDPARSSVALHAQRVRAALARCRKAAAALHDAEAARRADAVEAGLQRALSAPDGGRAGVAAADTAASALERGLILAGAARASLARERESLGTRLRAAVARADEVRALAARCASDVARPPVLAVPDPTRLGGVPEDDPDAFARRLDRVEAALREATERYEAPLAELAELRGLLDAYRAKALATGLSDPGLVAAYAAAREALAERPCDLATARDLVGSYRGAVESGDEARQKGGRR